MPSSGFFELVAYTDLAAADVFAAVDVSDPTQSPQGSLKKITAASVFAAAQPITLASGTVTLSTPVFQATQTWNAGAVTFTAIDLNVTSTASAAASLLMNLRVASTSMWKVDKSGNETVAGLATFNGGATVASGQTLTLTGATVAGSPTWSAAQAFAAITATSVTASTALALTAVGSAVINVTSGAANSAYTQYIRGATNKWASGTSILVGDGFEIYNNTLNADGLAIDVTTNNATFGGSVSVKSTTLLATSLALTNGAAAATGTLTNAPAAGNPTKWVPINDNGTTRYIPAW